MQTHQPDAVEYVPHTTLGRTGYVPDKESLLHIRIAQLDALLTVVSTSDSDDDGFQSRNVEIQRTVLQLASDLATEVHELHEETSIARYQERQAADSRGSVCHLRKTSQKGRSND